MTYPHDDPEPMPRRTELTEAERLTLEEMSRNHPFRDFRPRALGVLALGKGHAPKVVADILGVTAQTVYNWEKRWRLLGLMGLLDAAEAAARAEPCALKEIACRVREAYPEAADFSLDRLVAGLKARGLSWKRTRLSLKKNGAPSGSRRPAIP